MRPDVLSTQVARGWTWTRCYLVRSRITGRSILVDPATISDEERQHLRKTLLSGIGPGSVIAVVLTHGHPDHISDADYWASELEAPIAASEADLPILEDSALNGSGAFGLDIALSSGIGLPLEEGSRFELSPEEVLRVMSLPGHSPGSIGLHHVGDEERDGSFLVSGDILFQGSIGTDSIPGFGPLWKASLEEEIRTIRERILTLPDDTLIYPGHGPNTTVGEEKRANPFLV